ncbi:hypothetical protein GCM10009838_72420 [Catenulispora subtropica]|uniref:Uncharacterized protein n=1 Tax=Catenulispora subtropica TaxID=450798 RepID=A0ABN2T1M3_9ACTN
MSTMAYTPAPTGTGLKATVQKFGSSLASMVMPNIGAFIAWGLITALFIPTGWTPSAGLGKLVGPMITYLLPILIGYTGGRIVHGQRGAVIGAVATMASSARCCSDSDVARRPGLKPVPRPGPKQGPRPRSPATPPAPRSRRRPRPRGRRHDGPGRLRHQEDHRGL